MRPPRLPEAVVATGGAVLLVLAGAIGAREAGDAVSRAGTHGRVPRGAAPDRRGLPARRAVRRRRRGHGAPFARQPAAAAGARVRDRHIGHRGAEPRRHGGPAHADRLRHRGADARQPEAARLRVLASGQLGVPAAARVQPHEPAGVPCERPVVHAVRGAHGAAHDRRRRHRMDRVEAVLRDRSRTPAAPGASTASAAAAALCAHRAGPDARRLRRQLRRGDRTGLDRGRGGRRDDGARGGRARANVRRARGSPASRGRARVPRVRPRRWA